MEIVGFDAEVFGGPPLGHSGHRLARCCLLNELGVGGVRVSATANTSRNSAAAMGQVIWVYADHESNGFMFVAATVGTEWRWSTLIIICVGTDSSGVFWLISSGRLRC